MDVRSVRLVALLGLVFLLAGGGGSGPGTPTVETMTTTPGTETATATPTVTRCRTPGTGRTTRTPGAVTGTGAPGTPTATEPGFEFSPDRETPVVLRNGWSREVRFRVRVVCAPTNETVHDRSDTVGAGESRSVYDLGEASPGGRVPLRVVVTARNETESVTVETTACADVTGEVRDDGDLRVWATC
jgi:hypothetical protein